MKTNPKTHTNATIKTKLEAVFTTPSQIREVYTYLLLLFSFTTYAQTHAQKDTTNMNPFANYTKHQLIVNAGHIINAKYPDFTFDPSAYEITAWSNSKKTIVKYRRIISFTPLDKIDAHLSFDFEVNLTNQYVSPFDIWGMDSFYIPTEAEQQQIDFVIKAFGRSRFGFHNSIIEDPDMYRINVDNDMSFGNYFLDKTTGEELMGSVEGHYEPMPDFPDLPHFPDPLVEITD